MNEYISNIINTISNYSRRLNNTALFVNRSWVFLDSDNNQETYIFKGDGRLIMSRNGDVKIGKWEYIPEAESILIDRIVDIKLLNQGFIDDALMLLKFDGQLNDDYLILLDKNRIPDLDVIKYLRALNNRNRNIKIIPLRTGGTLEVEDETYRVDGSYLASGIYFDDKNSYMYEISGGRLNQKYTIKRYFARNKNEYIFISQRIPRDYYRGDFAYSADLSPLADGKYMLGVFDFIEVEAGRITNAR